MKSIDIVADVTIPYIIALALIMCVMKKIIMIVRTVILAIYIRFVWSGKGIVVLKLKNKTVVIRRGGP